MRKNLDLDLGFSDLDDKNGFEWCFCDLGMKSNDFLAWFYIEIEKNEWLQWEREREKGKRVVKWESRKAIVT